MIRCWKKNVQIKIFCNMRKYVDASHYRLVWLGSLSMISVTCNTNKKKKKMMIWYQHGIALCMVIFWNSFFQLNITIHFAKQPLIIRDITFLYINSSRVLPVAQRAMKVWTCLRISASLSSGSGSLLTMCSMKSFGVTAAKFHFNFPNTTSSHSWRERERDTGRERREDRERRLKMRNTEKC